MRQAWRLWGSAWLTQPRATPGWRALHTMTCKNSSSGDADFTATHRCGNRAQGYYQRSKRAASERLRTIPDRGSHEAALIYTEPPSYPRPVVEGWVAIGSALGDARIAERAERDHLKREAGSDGAYFGLAAALRAPHRVADAQKIEGKGREAWNKAEPDLPQHRTVSDWPQAGRR
jgi:hypothetical protein